MGNILKDTAGKIAGNVTQSVASAVIVFLITTYVLVDIGKKDKSENPQKVDSSSMGIKVSPDEKPDKVVKQNVDPGHSPETPAKETQQLTRPEQQSTSTQSVPPGSGSQETLDRDAINVSLSRVADKKKEPTLSNAQIKIDTLAKEKKPEDEIKKVKKRADDVFDELEEEVKSKPPR